MYMRKIYSKVGEGMGSIGIGCPYFFKLAIVQDEETNLKNSYWSYVLNNQRMKYWSKHLSGIIHIENLKKEKYVNT